jgi:hypothetical protein
MKPLLRISSLLAFVLLVTTLVPERAGAQFQRSLECFFCAAFDRSGSSSGPATNAQFDRIKALAGNWSGTNKHGKTVKVSYTVVSDGAAVMERLFTPEGGGMITMYYPDGERLMVTHYCSAGNHPRMLAAPPKPGDSDIAFSFFDVTYVHNSGANGGYMRALKFHFADKNHFTQDWTFGWNDGRQEVENLNLHRIV